MIRRPPRSTRTDTLFPYTTLVRSLQRQREKSYQNEKLTALGSLLAGVSHELNNPLSVVIGQAALLESIAGDSEIAERAVKVRIAADRCAKIVKTFLSMARQRPEIGRATCRERMCQEG